jgi:beta-1,4-N-acetylglucosaminyltransferase
MSIFVTVGTTRFDGLVKASSSRDFAKMASSKYNSIVIQHGNSPFIGDTKLEGVKLRGFSFSPNLHTFMQQASLIVSHAGSGSILEALQLEKPLIVVVNDELMDNHQAEVAVALGQDGLQCCVWTTPDNLIYTLQTFDASKLRPLPPREPLAFTKMLDDVCNAQS